MQVTPLTDLCLQGNRGLWQPEREKKDKDGADTAREIGEEEDRNWRVLLRIGRACLQPIDWFADALINGAS